MRTSQDHGSTERACLTAEDAADADGDDERGDDERHKHRGAEYQGESKQREMGLLGPMGLPAQSTV